MKRLWCCVGKIDEGGTSFLSRRNIRDLLVTSKRELGAARVIYKCSRFTPAFLKAMDLMNSKTKIFATGESKDLSRLKKNRGTQSSPAWGTLMCLKPTISWN